MTDRAARYGAWIVVLAVVGMLAIIGIVWGELTNRHLLTATMIGVILLAYSFILLCLRKGGFTGV